MTEQCEKCKKDMVRYETLNDYGYCIGCVTEMLQCAYWALHGSLPLAKGWADFYAEKYLPVPDHVGTTAKRQVLQHNNTHRMALAKVNKSLTEIEGMHKPLIIRNPGGS